MYSKKIVHPWFLTLWALCWLVACAEAPKAPADNAPPAPASTPIGPAFVLSKSTPPVDKTERATNWCIARFGDPLVINAERVNTNRRYFYPGPGIHKLMVGPSGATAILLFRTQPGGNVLVFTSDNFPECLSNTLNYSPAGGTASIRYNNRQNIDFRLDMEVENTRTKITVELPPAGAYGMSVNPCLECRE